MNITLQNYEEYMVRFLDGELNAEEREDVHLFLQQYPELKAELDAFSNTVLSPDESFVFQGKESLKRGITAENYEDFFIRKIEGELSPAEEKDVAEFLQVYPQFQRDADGYAMTQITADTSIYYPDKSSLKKHEPGVIPVSVRYLVAVAVAASLFLIFYMKGIPWNDQSSSPEMAQQDAVQDSHPEVFPEANQDKHRSKTAKEKVSSPEPIKSNSGRKKEIHNESQLLADNSATPVNSGNAMIADMEKIGGNSIEPIYYQPKFRKAAYRSLPENERAEKKSGANIKTFASGIGSELLKISGREDYLSTARSFNNRKETQPLALNIEAGKFGFYHKFFKKNSQKNSSPDKNSSEL